VTSTHYIRDRNTATESLNRCCRHCSGHLLPNDIIIVLTARWPFLGDRAKLPTCAYSNARKSAEVTTDPQTSIRRLQ